MYVDSREQHFSTALTRTPSELPAKMPLGRSTHTQRFPFVALILFKGSFCTGSILAQNWILTSATCAEGYEHEYIKNHALIKVGNNIPSDFPDTIVQIRRIHMTMKPDGERQEARFSLLLCLLDSPLKWNSRVAQVAPGVTVTRGRRLCGLVAWAGTKPGTSVDTLLYRGVLVQPCFGASGEELLCSYGPWPPLCGAMLGAPLLCNGRLVGVAVPAKHKAGSRGCGDQIEYTVFSPVVRHLGWISRAAPLLRLQDNFSEEDFVDEGLCPNFTFTGIGVRCRPSWLVLLVSLIVAPELNSQDP